MATRDKAVKATTARSPLLRDGAGSRSIWRGMGAPLSVAAGVNASIFLTYGWSGRYYDERRQRRRQRQQRQTTTHNTDNDDARDNLIERTAFCAAAAGTASSLVVCLSEHVKTKLQTQKEQQPRTPRAANDARLPPRHYRDSFHAARRILSDHPRLRRRKEQSGGFCIKHGAPNGARDVCGAEGCDKYAHANGGYCSMHSSGKRGDGLGGYCM